MSRLLLTTLALTWLGAGAWAANDEPPDDTIAVENSLGMRMIRVAAGSFAMGSQEGDWDEQPVHQVTIRRPFWMSASEVTLPQYQQFRPKHALAGPSGAVTGVSWHEAMAFCRWLSEKEGKPYRLPTEAEWEHACRLNVGAEPAVRLREAEELTLQMEKWTYYLFSREDPAGEIVLPGNDRQRTGSSGYVPLVAAKDGPCRVEVRHVSTGHEYGLVRADVGAKLFMDRDYRIARFSPALAGATLVKTWVADEEVTADRHLVLHADKPVTLYLAFCEITRSLPGWMSDFRAHGRTAARISVLPLSTEGRIGLRQMGDAVAEWCLDWHGEYRAEDQIDPVGPAEGLARVIRGDKPDDSRHLLPGRSESFYRRGANRAGMAPGFGASETANDGPAASGRHSIGFRVMQAPAPETKPYPADVPLVRCGVKQSTVSAAARHGPDPARPYFRKRYLLPTPPETIFSVPSQEQLLRHRRTIAAAGLHPAFCGHNHSPAVEVLPNGDVLLAIFTSWNEYEPDTSLMLTRLRFGSDTWEMPSYGLDLPDACDNCPLLWTEAGQIHLFWANTGAIGGYPFQWISSADSGATWGEVRFPRFVTPLGPHSRQPVNSVLRDRTETLYVASDAVGASSLLWVSRDGMQTWADPGGRTGGRHTTFVLLQDGRTILGMGGKSSDLAGYLPQSLSSDGGKTWQVSKTAFPAYSSNQRPCILRLASGRLFFCGDFQRSKDRAQPPGIRDHGAFVALSDDDGRTWRIKKLAGTQPHESPSWYGPADTIGYSVARQAPNGVIHLIATMNRPCLHLELNEAWILSDAPPPGDDARLMANTATSIRGVERREERYASGQPKIIWHAGIGDDGRYLLHGEETWYYPDGGRQYVATYALGRKVGTETFYRTDGSRSWQREHRQDGTSIWTQWYSSGTKKAESVWQDFHAHGPARTWDRAGQAVSSVVFQQGDIARSSSS